MPAPSKRRRDGENGDGDSRVTIDFELARSAEYAKLAKVHAADALSEAPDDALAAECARRNLRLVFAGYAEEAIAVTYETLSLLGTGSSGTVHEVAPKANPEKRYALKTMLRGGGNAEGYENADSDMVQEIGFLKRLHHPSIGGVIEVFESPKAFHLVLEELKGGEVHDFLSTIDHFYEHNARRITGEMLEALKYLQEVGIAHRDIKVENLLLTAPSRDASVKICDFGLAADVSHTPGYDGRRAAALHSCKAIKGEGYYGTLATMAPEVMDDDAAYGPQCDVYSAGCVAFSLLSGLYPFDADTADEFEALVKGRPKASPAPYEGLEEFKSISAEARACLDSLMCHNPGARPTAAQALELPWLKGAGGDGPQLHGHKAKAVKANKMAKLGRSQGRHKHVAKNDHVCTLSM